MTRRPAVLSGVATLVATLLLALTPTTHGAFTAVLGTPTTASLNPYLTCVAAAQAERSRGAAVFDYPLDDPAGSSQAADLSGSGSTGAYSGAMATADESGMPCRRDGGTAWAPDGSTSGLESPVVTLRSRFTFEVRFRTTRAGCVIAALTPPSYPTMTYALALRSGRIVLTGPGGDILTGSSNGVNDGVWHHLAMAVTDDGIVIALDSAVIASSVFNMPDNVAVVWHLAYDNASNSLGLARFQGAMRYAELTNRKLSAAEVRAHDAAGLSPALPSSSPSSTPSATPGPTGTPAPTASPIATASPTASATPAPSASASPEPTATATAAPAPSASPIATASSQPVEEEGPDDGQPIIVVVDPGPSG